MSETVCAPINTFSANSAADAAKELPIGRGYRGVLESFVKLDDGLIRAVLDGHPIDVPDSLESKLRKRLGKPTELVNFAGELYVIPWRRT